MRYLIKGKASQIFSAFDTSRLMGGSGNTEIIAEELLTAPFLGTEIQATEYAELWENQAVISSYMPGNMSAGNLQCLFGEEPLKKPQETTEEYRQHYTTEQVTYLSETNSPCALIIMRRRDDPSQWAIGFVKNAHLAPQDRDIILLSSQDFSPNIKNPEAGIVKHSSVAAQDRLLEQLGSPELYALVNNIMTTKKDGVCVINNRAERLKLLTRFLQRRSDTFTLPNPIDTTEFKLAELFADNPALDLLIKYYLDKNFSLSSGALKDCIVGKAPLAKQIKKLKLSSDESLNKRLVIMTVVFYEANTLSQNLDLLADHQFIERFKGFMWDRVQITLLSFMRQAGYDEDLMKIILADEAFYKSINTLIQLKSVQDVPELLRNPQKFAELKLIHNIADEDCRQLCLIFWAKASFKKEDYEEIIATAKKYPLMAGALVDLDIKQVHPDKIDGIRALTREPENHLKLAIKYHFFNPPEPLSLTELEAASSALLILRNAGFKKVEFEGHYQRIVAKGNKAQALRIFLMQLAEVRPLKHQKELMDILYTGINDGIPDLGNKVLAIKDAPLRTLAEGLGTRFACVRQLQRFKRLDMNNVKDSIKFDDEMILWAAQEPHLRAESFRQIILQVEAQCKIISQRLLKSSKDSVMNKKWDANELLYRQQLYRIAYQALTAPAETVLDSFDTAQKAIKALEQDLLAIIDPPFNSQLYKAIVVIANIVITAITVGLAPFLKWRGTGNPWFFTHTRSGEEIRTLTKGVVKNLSPTDEDPEDIEEGNHPAL